MSESDESTVEVTVADATDEPLETTTAVIDPVETTTAPRKRAAPRRKPCRAKGCDGLAGAKGWCAEHHRRWLNAQGRR